MAGGGFGGGPYGGGPWGGSATDAGDLVNTSETVNVTEGLTVEVPFEVQAAVPLFSTLLRVDFTSIYDPLHIPNLVSASYSIPGLTVFDVDPHPTLAKSVLLLTSPQEPISYTLTVSVTTQGIGGDPMNPLANTAVFDGFGLAPTFFAAAQSETKVQVVFVSEMTIDAEFIDPLNYTLVKIDGTPISVIAVTAIGSENRHAELTLGDDLEQHNYYALTISSNVQTVDSQPLFPDTDVFPWAKYVPSPITVDISRFTGEVETGLLGQPAGQVFFSPALEAAAANSIIEVDEVNVCTRAYDVYEIPELPDPPILYTYPPPDTSLATSDIGGAGILFASAERQGLARVNLQYLPEDTYTPPEDGPADAELVETIDITSGGFLNDPRWETYPAATASIGAFTIADNLSPIGPGPTTNINLQPAP